MYLYNGFIYMIETNEILYQGIVMIKINNNSFESYILCKIRQTMKLLKSLQLCNNIINYYILTNAAYSQ